MTTSDHLGRSGTRRTSANSLILLACCWLIGFDAFAATLTPTLTSFLAGATVFRDANGNGQPDDGEPAVRTDGRGKFTLPAAGAGRLQMTGGTHILSGQGYPLLLAIPEGGRSAGVLSSLWLALAERHVPNTHIRKLLHFAGTPSQAFGAENGKTTALNCRETQLETLALYLESIAIGRGLAHAIVLSPAQLAEDRTIAALAEALSKTNPSESPDFADPTSVEVLLSGALSSLGIAPDGDSLPLIARGAAYSINERVCAKGLPWSRFTALAVRRFASAAYLASSDLTGFRRYLFPPAGVSGIDEDTGNDPGDGVTRDNKPLFFGPAGPDAVKIRLYRNGQPVGPDLLPDHGLEWRWQSGKLADGTHTFTVAPVSAEGSVGAQSDALTVTVDTAAPPPPTVSPLTAATPTPTLTGTWSGDTANRLSVSVDGVSYSDASGIAATGTIWSLAVPAHLPLRSGARDVKVTERDPAGNAATDRTRREIRVTNLAPVADAGQDRYVDLNSTVRLEGKGSDANGEPLAFRWKLVGRPAGSRAKLADARSPTPRFKADKRGVYAAELVVSDGQVRSAPARVRLTSGSVTVSVQADAGHPWPLHYHWKVSEGSIDDVDAPTTTWTLSPGPGVHFANVLISDRHGGYAARRIAAISDDLGTRAPASSDRDFSPPADAGHVIAADTLFAVIGYAGNNETLPVSRAVYQTDLALPVPTLDPVSSLQGRIVYPFDLRGAGADFGHVYGHFDNWEHGHPYSHGIWSDYVVGSAHLADGNRCGIDDPFHGVSATATATLATIAGVPIGNPVRVNAWGDYALPWSADAAFVRLQCEEAEPVLAGINPANHIAETALFAGTGVPPVSSDPSAMTARIDGGGSGIFLPPQLGQPSDAYPSGELFLAFKGMDSQLQACEYYRSIGAVASCDEQGRFGGAIRFDDWKRKTGMEPYVKSGGREIDATYVNRIDLNLTRRHHAVAYEDKTPLRFLEAQAQNPTLANAAGCGIRPDGRIACWGNNLISSSVPDGVFSQLSVPVQDDHVCALRQDSTVACWGANDYGESSAPAGNFNQVSAGREFSCGLTSKGALVCWGTTLLADDWNHTDELAGTYKQVSAGDRTVCAIDNADLLTCWGANSAGIATPPAGRFLQVSVGVTHACGVASDHTIRCWGDDAYGQSTPPSGTFDQVAAGLTHSCGLRSNGHLACWGEKPYSWHEPPAGSFARLAGDSCALTAIGTLNCWLAELLPLGRVAAYVCNHLGPSDDSQEAVDAAIANAVQGRNEVACVAMDYGRQPGPEALPYVRFYIFAPNGELLPSINLDGRQEKYIPGTCVACHGGDKYDGHFVGDGRGSPDFGGHFLPYDTGNFAFSSRPGLTKADQAAAIRKLNDIALKTNATPIEKALVKGWYAKGTDELDEDYWPSDWQAEARKYPDLDMEGLYKHVHARYCRTCHVAFERLGSHTRSDNPEVPWTSSSESLNEYQALICGGSPWVQRNHTMPNSLVTFNRLWKDPVAVALLQKTFGNSCRDSGQRDPKLDDPFAVVSDPPADPPTIDTAFTLDGSISTSPSGAPLTYQWSLETPVGSGASLADSHLSTPTFTPDVPGTYVAQLQVASGDTTGIPSRRLSLQAYAAAPKLQWSPANPHIGDTVMLDGTGSRAMKGGPLTYRWTLAPPPGSQARLDDSTSAQPSFVPDVGGNYFVTLSVNDSNEIAVAIQAYTVDAKAEAPAATFGTVPVRSPIVLDASKSSSFAGRPLNYTWQLVYRPDGSHATLQNPNTATPTFTADLPGSYAFAVYVDDGDLGGTSLAFLPLSAVEPSP
jgi:hypothetical protein